MKCSQARKSGVQEKEDAVNRCGKGKQGVNRKRGPRLILNVGEKNLECRLSNFSPSENVTAY